MVYLFNNLLIIGNSFISSMIIIKKATVNILAIYHLRPTFNTFISKLYLKIKLAFYKEYKQLKKIYKNKGKKQQSTRIKQLYATTYN